MISSIGIITFRFPFLCISSFGGGRPCREFEVGSLYLIGIILSPLFFFRFRVCIATFMHNKHTGFGTFKFTHIYEFVLLIYEGLNECIDWEFSKLHPLKSLLCEMDTKTDYSGLEFDKITIIF